MFSITIFLLTASMYVTITSAGSCSSIAGNMHGTVGCLTLRPQTRFLTIDCDGKYRESLRNILREFRESGCNLPIALKIRSPRFPVSSELFTDVAKHIYRMELTGLKDNQTLQHTFSGMQTLRMLKLHFDDKNRDPVSFDRGMFQGLHNLEEFRVFANDVPITIERDAFGLMHHVKCIYWTGKNLSCNCGAFDFVNWLYRRNDVMLLKFQDPLSHRSAPCHIHVDCAPPLSSSNIFQPEYLCTGE